MKLDVPLEQMRRVDVENQVLGAYTQTTGLLPKMFGATLTDGEKTWVAHSLQAIIDDPETLGSAGD